MNKTPEKRVRALPSRAPRLVAALLRWFANNARDLPWRRTLDPYAIWVSEIMLQQTQVKTVIPYWERWMRELPDARALAKAAPDKVLKLWEGLGYYTRARNLQKAAQQIAREHGGKFPTAFDNILALPGVGRYTAGAIASIAFDQTAPILDGNVIRVLTRLFGIAENPREKETNARLWNLAETLVQTAADRRRQFSILNFPSFAARQSAASARRRQFSISGATSALNQSLMELGALVCAPRQPRCGECPVRRQCEARKTGRVEKLPNLAKRPTASARRFVAFLVQRKGRWLVQQRSAGVINAHLWEFPNLELPAGVSLAMGAIRLFGRKPQRLVPLATIKHSITRYRISLEACLTGIRGKIRDSEIAHRGQEPRVSVLDCGSPLPLSDAPGPSTSARGLAQSKTSRQNGRFKASCDLQPADAHRSHEPRSAERRSAGQASFFQAEHTRITARWLSLAELDHLPFTSAHRKVLQALQRHQNFGHKA